MHKWMWILLIPPTGLIIAIIGAYRMVRKTEDDQANQDFDERVNSRGTNGYREHQ